MRVTAKEIATALWEATGLQYGDLIEELIQLGLNRYEQRQKFLVKL